MKIEIPAQGIVPTASAEYAADGWTQWVPRLALVWSEPAEQGEESVTRETTLWCAPDLSQPTMQAAVEIAADRLIDRLVVLLRDPAGDPT